jgi:hypothetical protein
MGGSGGGFFGGGKPEVAKRQLERASEQSTDALYSVTCEELLGRLLVRFNDRDVKGIRARLAEIKSLLSDELDAQIDLEFGGSVAKHTYVDGLSDVDALLFIENCSLAAKSPEKARGVLAQKLRKHSGDSVSEGSLAVSVSFPEAEVQLVPAISCKGSVRISNEKGTDWAPIQPRVFSEQLSRANARAASKLVPVIKLAKAAIAGLPAQQQVSGYHVEATAMEVFKNYDGPARLREMVKHFFREASERVLRPMADPTRQSRYIDEYLGAAGSLERRIVADAFGRVTRRIANADRNASLEEWNRLFGEE